MIKKKLSVGAIFLIMLGLLASLGCGEKKTGIMGFAMRDDGELPAQPQDLHYVVNNIYTGQTIASPNNYYFRVKISWSPVTTNILGQTKDNIVGYKVYRNGRNAASLIGMTDRENTTFVDVDEVLADDTQQIYYVSAYDSLMRESFSTSLTVKIVINGAIPNPPRDLFLIPGNHAILLSWTKPLDAKDPVPTDDQVVSYRIKRRTDSDRTYTDLAIVLGEDSTHYSDGNLSEGVRYYYTIQALTRIGNESKPTVEKGMTVANLSLDDGYAPTAPENPQVRIEGSSATVTWDNPLWDDNGTNGATGASGVMGYHVYRAEMSPSTGALGKFVLRKVLNRVNSWTDNDINSTFPAGTYWYEISAFDDAGNEGDRCRRVTDISNPIPATPRNLAAKVDIVTNKISLEWTYRSGMVYNVYESNNGKWYKVVANKYNPMTSQSGIVDGQTVYYNIGTLTQGTTKYFKVSAVNTQNDESNMSYFIRVSRVQEWINAKYTLEAEQYASSSYHDARSVYEAAGMGNTWILDKWTQYWNGLYSGFNWNYKMSSDSITLPSGNSVGCLKFQPYQPYGTMGGYNQGNGPDEDWYSVNDYPMIGVWNQRAYEFDSMGNGVENSDLSTDWDNFQDQFRFWWTVPYTGTYDVKIYFVKVPRNGSYSALVRTDNFIVGAAQTVNPFVSTSAEAELSDPETEGGKWSSLSLTVADKLYFVFSAISPRQAVPSTHAGGHHDYFWDTELLIDRLEIERVDN